MAFLGALLVVLGPALRSPFFSDDVHYVRDNFWIHELTAENVAVILDPAGPATVAIVNYAPAQLLVHALAWQAFGPETLGHHVVNLALHALASLLLVALFLSTGVPRVGALLGGALFLLHPANVEAVVWISQLKTTLAMALMLAALLVHRRRPALAAPLFALALLAKATAAVALPVVALLDWTRDGRVRWRWLALWGAVLAGYALAEFATHQRSGAAEATLYESPFVLLRTIAALWARYLVMAPTSLGVSAFHEPEPARSLVDPWWLLSLPATALMLWRAVVVARRREPELAYWLWAVVSFGPVSQIFPFLYPLADRYLYFILPGLLGGVLLAASGVLARLTPAPRRRGAERAGVALGAALGLVFALHAHARAELWRHPALLFRDAALNYPNGKAAALLDAKRAAQGGDAVATAAALRRAAERGFFRFRQLETDPDYAAVRAHPEFRAVVREMATHYLERAERKEDPTQHELRMQAHAHIVRGELERAVRALERAVEQGGPLTDEIRREISAIRSAIEAGTPERVRLGPT